MDFLSYSLSISYKISNVVHGGGGGGGVDIVWNSRMSCKRKSSSLALCCLVIRKIRLQCSFYQFLTRYVKKIVFPWQLFEPSADRILAQPTSGGFTLKAGKRSGGVQRCLPYHVKCENRMLC